MLFGTTYLFFHILFVTFGSSRVGRECCNRHTRGGTSVRATQVPNRHKTANEHIHSTTDYAEMHQMFYLTRLMRPKKPLHDRP